MVKHLLALVGMGVAGYQSVQNYKSGGLNRVVSGIFGWDANNGNFAMSRMNAGIPLGLGIGGSYLAAKTGVNRYTPTKLNL